MTETVDAAREALMSWFVDDTHGRSLTSHLDDFEAAIRAESGGLDVRDLATALRLVPAVRVTDGASSQAALDYATLLLNKVEWFRADRARLAEDADKDREP